MRRILTVLFTITLLAAACGDDGNEITDAANNAGSGDTGDGDNDSGDSDSGDSDSGNSDSGNSDSDDSDSDDTNFSGADSENFCQTARQIDEEFDNRDATDMFTTEGIEELEGLYRGVINIAPDEIRGDFEIALGGFIETANVIRENGGDFFSAGEALESLDTTEWDNASDRIDSYLTNVCGIDNGGDIGDDIDVPVVPGSIPDIDFDGSETEIIQQIFGVDADTAECLLAEFGGSEIDPGALTGGEICGMSVLELVQGMSVG